LRGKPHDKRSIAAFAGGRLGETVGTRITPARHGV
jgi:hypothetical protein